MSSSQTVTSSSSQNAPSASASSTNNNTSGFGGSSPSGFYRNLFYILIGLLCAFVIVSIVTLCRTRYRRRLIVEEANRLGVMVPGVPGYISMRDRVRGIIPKTSGWSIPHWWEVVDSKDSSSSSSTHYDFTPISVTPLLSQVEPLAPVPVSTLRYFPQSLAYRPEMYDPPPAVPQDINELIGTQVDVGVLVRMPVPERPQREPTNQEEEDGVAREWEGVELGVLIVDIVSSRQ